MEILTSPAPPARTRVRRLTAEMKALQPGQSFITDSATARCAISHFRYLGLPAVQQKHKDGTVQVWRVA